MHGRAVGIAATALVCAATAARGDGFAFRGELTAGVANVRLGGDTFAASGTASGKPTLVSESGQAIGLDRVELVSFAAHLQFGFAPHVAAGVVLGGLTRQVALGDGTAAESFAGNLSALQLGVETSTFWRARFVEARVSLAFGARTVWLPVDGLDTTTCPGKASQPYLRCIRHAVVSDPFVEPRLTLGIMPVSFFSFGGYVGGDVLTTGGWTAGAYVAFGTPGWSGVKRKGRP
jgi:hypothetical protein